MLFYSDNISQIQTKAVFLGVYIYIYVYIWRSSKLYTLFISTKTIHTLVLTIIHVLITCVLLMRSDVLVLEFRRPLKHSRREKENIYLGNNRPPRNLLRKVSETFFE